MTDQRKWWLIDDKEIQAIRAALVNAYKYSLNQEDKADYAEMIMLLDTGLHVTDAVPADFAEETAQS